MRLAGSIQLVGSMLLVGVAVATASVLVRMDAAVAGPAAVGTAVLLAALVEGRPSPFAVGVGAASAAAFMVVWPSWPALAGGALLSAAHLPRSLRAADRAAAVTVLALAALGGGVGAWLAAAFDAAALPLHLVALGMAALLAGAPWLVAVDDPVAFGLRTEARTMGLPLRWTMLRAVVLRRRLNDASAELPRNQRRRLERAWQTLLQLARTWHGSPRSARDSIHARIVAHVRACERLCRAWSARRALADGLDGDELDELGTDGAALEAEVSALCEVGWEG